MSDATDETELIGRNELGRFEPGNRCSANRSSRAAELKRAFTEAVTADDIAEIARTLVRQAIDGDTQAAKLILDRCCGKADSGPLVAVQMNQQANGPGASPGRAAAIIERLRAARGEAPAEPDAPITLEQALADLDRRIERLGS